MFRGLCGPEVAVKSHHTHSSVARGECAHDRAWCLGVRGREKQLYREYIGNFCRKKNSSRVIRTAQRRTSFHHIHIPWKVDKSIEGIVLDLTLEGRSRPPPQSDATTLTMLPDVCENTQRAREATWKLKLN